MSDFEKTSSRPERFRHLKTGGTYQVLFRGVGLQTSLGMTDGETVVIYQGEDGRVWAREEVEFNEPTRFEPLT